MSDFEPLDINDENNGNPYDHLEYFVTVDDIAALLSGKALWNFNDEFDFAIILERGEKE